LEALTVSKNFSKENKNSFLGKLSKHTLGRLGLTYETSRQIFLKSMPPADLHPFMILMAKQYVEHVRQGDQKPKKTC
jgi:hypothetical protein